MIRLDCVKNGIRQSARIGYEKGNFSYTMIHRVETFIVFNMDIKFLPQRPIDVARDIRLALAKKFAPEFSNSQTQSV